MIDYTVVKSWAFDEIGYDYRVRDTLLYALSVGFGSDPLDEGQLRFVYEKHLQTVPTMASIMGSPGLWWRDPRTGADAARLVHGEQHLRFHRPLPAQGRVIVRNRVQSLTDKGPGKGAIGVVRRDILSASGDLLAQGTNVSFLRGDGGFSVTNGLTDPLPEALPRIQERPADLELILASTCQAALVYRLNGDDNPLHADPAVARAAHFERPILHGLCTYGMACHAVLRACLGYDPLRLRALAVRFTAPVYPGESVRFELWREDSRHWRLRAHVDERRTKVMDCGTVEID